MKVRVREVEDEYLISLEEGEVVDAFSITKELWKDTPPSIMIEMIINRTITSIDSIDIFTS